MLYTHEMMEERREARDWAAAFAAGRRWRRILHAAQSISGVMGLSPDDPAVLDAAGVLVDKLPESYWERSDT